MPEAQPAPDAAAPRVQFPGRRVLVVDDTRMNRMFLAAMLRTHGCDADEAADGAAAVEAVSRVAYDLVLMDVHMPVMDGPTASQAIRAAGLAGLPIFALTATRTSEQARLCEAAGMDGLLAKPLSPAELAAALARVFAPSSPAAAPRQPAPAPDQANADQRLFEAAMGREPALRFVRLFQQQLRERFQAQAPEILADDAHKTAGSAGLMGLHALAAAAADLEQAFAERRDPAVTLLAVRRLVRDAQLSLEQWCSRLSPSP